MALRSRQPVPLPRPICTLCPTALPVSRPPTRHHKAHRIAIAHCLGPAPPGPLPSWHPRQRLSLPELLTKTHLTPARRPPPLDHSPRNGLLLVFGVWIGVINDHCVRGLQVEAPARGTNGEQEDEGLAVGGVEALDGGFPASESFMRGQKGVRGER